MVAHGSRVFVRAWLWNVLVVPPSAAMAADLVNAISKFTTGVSFTHAGLRQRVATEVRV